MNVLWIFAHPEPRSLNGALRDVGRQELQRLGHDLDESDLYAMHFDPVLDSTDFARPAERLFVGTEQQRGYADGTLAPDIRREQDKLAWADTVVLQFPLWWLGPPAILKGWLDRVLVQGLGFGVRGSDGHVRRYGDGALAGKRGLIVTTIGARASSFGPRGIHGPVDDVLFGLQHGTFFYTGIQPLSPYVVYGADRIGGAGFAAAADGLRRRLGTLASEPPIPFRPEAGGDYDENLVLRPMLAPGASGLAVHRHDGLDGLEHRGAHVA